MHNYNLKSIESNRYSLCKLIDVVEILANQRKRYQDFEREIKRWERDLRKALEGNGFHLEYQPKVALKDQSLTGAEALVRWDHPQRGRVSPADFIPLAEETGLIVPIGEWLLREATKVTRLWQGRFDIPLTDRERGV